MVSENPPDLSRRRIGVALALTAVAGFVDVFGWLSLNQVYTATASGNTVLIAVHAAAGQAAAALLYAFTVGMYLAGLLLGNVAIELGLRRGFCRVLSIALGIEAACLATFAIWGAPLVATQQIGTTEQPHAPLFLLIALAAVAMGVQNTSLRAAGVVGVFTTHVTGTLTRFSEQLVDYGFGLAGRPIPERPPARAGRVLFSAGLWLAFLIGGGGASLLTPRWGPRATLLLPIALVLLIAGIDLARPFAEPRR